MRDYKTGTKVGGWDVRWGREVRPDGVRDIIVISDGKSEFQSPEDPSELMIALATHLGVMSWNAPGG